MHFRVYVCDTGGWTDHRMDDWFDFRQSKDFFSLRTASTPAVGPDPWIPAALSVWWKRSDCETDRPVNCHVFFLTQSWSKQMHVVGERAALSSCLSAVT